MMFKEKAPIAALLAGQNIRTVVILTDKNVNSLYPDYFQELYKCCEVHKIVVPAGERHKNIRQAVSIWQFLTGIEADRHTLMLNFGGGMICDLGGFVASTYKRGIYFAHCSTTLLAMIDAAIGGKNGIDFDNIKNCIGIIRQPDYVFPADLDLLHTLPFRELQSGFGEMIKYALIADKALFEQLMLLPELRARTILPDWVSTCIGIKQRIVSQDTEDRRERHVLNFGHTIGHAVESLCVEQRKPIPHGVAVAVGLFYESRLSHRFGKLTDVELVQIEQLIRRHYPIPVFTKDVVRQLLPYLRQDKKNKSGRINITLLEHPGKAVPDFFAGEQSIVDALTGD